MRDRPLSIVFAGHHEGRGDFPRHHHEVWELIYLCDGAVITVQDGVPVHLSPGMILVNPPRVPHSDTYVRPYNHIYLFVEGSNIEDWDRVLYDDRDQPIRQVFNAVLREWRAPLPERESMLESLASQLEILMRRRTSKEPSNEGDPRLIEAESILRGSVGTPITLDELGHRVGVSRSWLHQEFGRAYGKTPHEYLAQLRLEKALALLRHSSHKVAFIATECGYGSGSHFTNVVRKAIGLSPSEIRELSLAHARRPSDVEDQPAKAVS